MIFDVVAFDFDGVLVESVDVKTQAFADLYRPWGEAIVAQVVSYHLAHGGVSRYEKFRHFHREFLGRIIDAEEEADLASRFAHMVEEAVIAAPMVEGAEDFLVSHASLLPFYIVSGTPQEELQRIVERRGLMPYFRGVYGSPRSKGDILSDIIQRCSVAPEKVLMIGDATTDYDGARIAGARFLGRVPKGDGNPFPDDVTFIHDLTSLASLL